MTFIIGLVIGVLLGHAFAEEIDEFVAKHK